MRYQPSGEHQDQSALIGEIITRLNLLSMAERNIGFMSVFKNKTDLRHDEIREKSFQSFELIRGAIPKGFRVKLPDIDSISDYIERDEAAKRKSNLYKFLAKLRGALIKKLQDIPSSKEKTIACLCARSDVEGDLPFWTLCLEGGWRDRNSLGSADFRDLLENHNGHISSLHWLYVLRFAGLQSGRASEEKIAEALDWYRSEFAAVGSLQDYGTAFNPEIILPDEGLWSLIGAVRSVKLRSAIFRYARRYCRGLLKSQGALGSWSLGYGPDCKPNAMATASICVAIGTFLGFSDDDVRHSTIKACDWLVSQQRKDGGWAHLKKNEADILVTALALDALRRCDSVHYCEEISHAEQFIVNMQRPDGLWDIRGRYQNEINALIAECLLGLSTDFSEVSQFSDLARDHYFFAVEGLNSEEGVGRQLVLIGLQMATEFFTYHLLNGFDPPEPYFNDQGRTVGLREALGLLEKRLICTGDLPSGAVLPFRTQLRELAIARDEVVHKIKVPSKGELRRYSEAVHSFFNRMSPGFLS